MNDHHAPDHAHRSRPPRALTIAAKPRPFGQVVGGVSGALAVSLAAIVATLLLVAGTARAQVADVEAVLDALTERAAALRDVTFVLDGELRDEAGQRIAIEVEVMAIPAERALSLYIVQPDALADNMVVIADDEVRNYTFLTNQVARYDLDDPDAFGGLLPGGGDTLSLELDLAVLFAGWDASIVDVEDGVDGEVYTLRFDNLDPGAAIAYVIAVVDGSDWFPQRLALYAGDGDPFADVRLIDVAVDTGLDVAEVTWLPDDAEVLDRRR